MRQSVQKLYMTLTSVHGAHSGFVIALARGHAARRDLRDALKICGAQVKLRGSQVFIKPRRVGGAWNRHYVRALRQEPRQGELRGGAMLFLGDFFDPVDQRPRFFAKFAP